MNKFFHLLFAVFLLATGASASHADDFNRGIVFAKIIGANKWTEATAEKGSTVYFYTTIAIANTKSNFFAELDGRRIKLRTGEFDKALVGQTIPLYLTKVARSDSRIEYSLDCSELNTSWFVAKYYLRPPK